MIGPIQANTQEAATCQRFEMVYTYLTMTTGARAGKSYLLDPTDENRIGRGMDCDIVLTDPLCSRVHALTVRERDGWLLRDAGSRNGTYLNEQRVDEVRLVEGSVIRVGSTKFTFHLSDQPPTEAGLEENVNVTETIIKDSPINPADTGEFGLAALQNPETAQDLLMLYQLSIRLLGCENPDEVVFTAIDLLRDRVKASVVGFLWVSDEGQLKPKVVIPLEAAGKVALSESLTGIVCKKRRAVWTANQAGDESKSLRHYADAICVPLIRDEEALGAVHMYLEEGRFEQQDFDFVISLSNIMAVALVRARQQATLAADHQRLVEKTGGSDELIGESKPMLDLKSRLNRVARATGCVLIRGESGAGKELVARAIHRASARADRPMLSVNCAAIPADLMESQLFGHKKGAFTGAESDHTGWFEQADSGTLFLDEVGEMTLEGQAKLLRILEGHPFLPVGASDEISVDVRVIAATNRDLRDFVRERRFREDLYYRLSVFELYIPPLRDRGPDIERLIGYFLEHFKAQHGRPNLELSEEARQKLLSYRWPGNVRQLRNVIDSAVVMAEDSEIVPEDLGLRDTGSGELESLRIDHWERKLIKEALGRTSGNIPDAAKLLGIGRATLYRKIDEYGIPR